VCRAQQLMTLSAREIAEAIWRESGMFLALTRSALRGHAPNHIANVIGRQQGALFVEGHTDRALEGIAVVAQEAR